MRNKTFVLESISVILAVITVYVVDATFLSTYSSYLLALLVIFSAIYISIKKRSKSASELFTGSALEIYGIVTITLLIILLTDGLASPLFFFIYFILFFLAFMSKPYTVWVFLISTILYFTPQASDNLNSDTFIKIGSLVLIAPIAFFVAKELQRRELLAKRIESKTDEIIKDAEILRESSLQSPDEDEVIDEIIEEAESLKKDSQS